MFRMPPGTDQEPSPVDHDGGDGIDAEGEAGGKRTARGGGQLYRHHLPFNLLFLTISISETIISASNPKSESHC